MAHCVLVAGEHWKVTTGEHNMGTNHCSMEHVGVAFDSLRAAGVPRDRIIVIAQIEERREWLRRAIASGEPRCTSAAADGLDDDEKAAIEASREIYTRKLVALEDCCGGIIREGGADYDADAVNPETVFNVLTAALNDAPSPATGPIVPRDCQGIALMIYSHGCSHETAPLDGEYYRNLLTTIPCDVCGKPHPVVEEASEATQPDHEHVSLRTNEWYIHLPHNAPAAAQAAVATQGPAGSAAETGADQAGRMVQAEIVAAYEGVAHSEHPHPFSLLYWQILFRIYHRRFSAAPSTPMLVLLNSCRSGGLTKFLEQELVDQTYGVHDWPLYVMSSSQAERDAVVGGLWTSWFKGLRNLQPATLARTDADGPHGLGAAATVSAYFDQVAAEYNKTHLYDLTNRLMSSWQIAQQDRAESGAFVTSLHRDCLPGGRVDYTALQRLVLDYDIQPRLYCVHCSHFSRGGARDGAGGGLLCSSCEREWVRGGHTEPPTQPDITQDRQAAVDQLLAVARQAEQAIARPWAWSGARSDFGTSSLRKFLLGLGEGSRLQGQDRRQELGADLAPHTDVGTSRRCLAVPANAASCRQESPSMRA